MAAHIRHTSSFGASPRAAHHSSWVGQPRVKGGREFTRMALLTASIIGLQFCWGTEMTYATPYLLALGLSKSHLSLVWIAGPLSGLVMQPVIGMVSDKSTSRYGRRRPFMLAGSVAVVACLLVLGWASEIVGWFVVEEEPRRRVTIWLAVVDIYVLDFAINIAQSTCRALVVDMLPVSKQQLGSAWVSRMVGVGHMLIYAVGALDLNALLGSFLGDTQFKKVCAIAAIAMLLAQSVTCWSVTERVLVSDGTKPHGTDQGVISIIKQIYISFSDCPERIQAVCWVQFWAWIGFFPFLFYGSTWVGEIYLRTQAHLKPENALSDVGRAGSTAMIVYSIVGFVAAIFLPYLVESPEGSDDKKDIYTPRPLRKMRSWLKWLKWLDAHRPTLLTVWTCSNLTFGLVMLWAPLVGSVGFATFLMSCCGIPFAVSQLATGTFLGVEVNKLSSGLPSSHRRTASWMSSDDYAVELDGVGDTEQIFLHLRHDSDASQGTSSTGELAGIYLGILNIYQTMPQMIGVLISWVVFSILEPGKSPELALDASPDERKSTDGLSGIGVCLFIGALSAFVAAYSTKRLRPAR